MTLVVKWFNGVTEEEHQRGGTVWAIRLSLSGDLVMVGKVSGAMLGAAPKQSNTWTEKNASKLAQKAHEIWPDEPGRAPQKDTDAR